jgi:hypothetical protein
MRYTASIDVAPGDWTDPAVRPQVTGLLPGLRERLAAHWTSVALMEHASIAAFARFTMHLLAVGAPPDLVVLSQRAMADETAHARWSFSLASAYAGRDIGPGPLGIDGSLGRFEVDAMVATLVREGCIGEPLAAVDALEGATRARDPVVRAVLARMADDETRHAVLAWRTLAWLVTSGRVDRSRAGQHLHEALREPVAVGSADPDMSAHGLTGDARRRELRELGIAQIVRPFAEAAGIRLGEATDERRDSLGGHACPRRATDS